MEAMCRRGKQAPGEKCRLNLCADAQFVGSCGSLFDRMPTMTLRTAIAIITGICLSPTARGSVPKNSQPLATFATFSDEQR
jgi:hypothetical protein